MLSARNPSFFAASTTIRGLSHSPIQEDDDSQPTSSSERQFTTDETTQLIDPTLRFHDPLFSELAKSDTLLSHSDEELPGYPRTAPQSPRGNTRVNLVSKSVVSPPRSPSLYASQLDYELSPTSSIFPQSLTSPHISEIVREADAGRINDLTRKSISHQAAHSLEYRRGSKPHNDTRFLSYSLTSASSHAREICIVVTGANNVGKSTFIQRCHELRNPSVTGSSSKAHFVDGVKYNVRLVELEISSVAKDKGPVIWPQSRDGERLPFVHGVLILYDVTSRKSLERIPDVLDTLLKASIPTLLVACKCDTIINDREVKASHVDHLATTLGVEVMQTSGASHCESQKTCITTMLWMVIRRKESKQRQITGRRRASSNNPRSESPRPPNSRGGHNRASSEHTGLANRQYPPTSLVESPTFPPGRGLRSKSTSTTNVYARPSTVKVHQTYIQSTTPTALKKPSVSEASDNGDVPLRRAFAPRTKLSKSSNESLVEEFSEMNLERVRSEQEDSVTELDEQEPCEKYAGVPFEDLVTRLLAQQLTQSDATFVIIFFCFYRRFASPKDLLTAILDIFEWTGENVQNKVMCISDQLRHYSVLYHWVSHYPGDFANYQTRQALRDHAEKYSNHRAFAGIARDIVLALLAIGDHDDDDSSWGRNDVENPRNSLHSFITTSTSSNDTTNTSDESYYDISKTSSIDERYTSENGGIQTTPLSSDMSPGITPFGREQYILFMDIPEEDVARELTRIDWNMFQMIKPRDFVRHVFIPASEKENNKSLEHVNKVIRHFNHIAYWVANLVLERPKAKHRARALEKFMNIAHLLRQMNNYNSLGAVIAGINGLALHRLSQTRALVSEAVQRKFSVLESLMATSKSHTTYRQALENTEGECIPFIPLHRRDLISADEGNRTLLVDNVNWRKFEIMGEPLMIILRCQATPYADLHPNTWTEKLISDTTISMNDDELMEGFQELYERSVLVEPGPSSADVQKAKRNWFKRQ